jgi:Calx-beta domain-containing protein/beta-propeller repeat-containing protein
MTKETLAFPLLIFLGIFLGVLERPLLFSDAQVSLFENHNSIRLTPLNRSELQFAGQFKSGGFAANRLPLYFVRNEGQIAQCVKYYAINGRTVIYFTTTGIFFSVLEAVENESVALTPPWLERKTGAFENRKLTRRMFKIVPHEASRRVQLQGAELQKTRFHYFLGNDARKWRRNVAIYRSVVYTSVYPGIDLKFYGNVSGQLEYDVIVRPGSDPSRIRFAYEGIRDLNRIPNGDLSVDLGGSTLLLRRPRIIQHIGSEAIEVKGGYHLYSAAREGRFLFGFELGRYDRKRTLFIDPVISFSTYLGGSDGEECLAMDRDSSGNLYVTGLTTSLDFPVTPGAFQTVSEDFSAFITKISPDGSSIIYSTYLGGSDIDSCSAIRVDETGAAYVGCTTVSSDFPTLNPFQANLNGYMDGAVAKLNPNGSALVYSTYLGGNDVENVLGIALHNHQVYAAGVTASVDFPIKDPLQGTYKRGRYDGFVSVLNASGDDLIYSTYLGGDSTDYAFGIDADSSGAAYVVGRTLSDDFPVTPGAFDTKCADGGIYCEDAFVSKIAPNGASLVYSTFLGGKKPDGALAVATDGDGAAYVTGTTASPDFPMVNPAQSGLASWLDAFVTKLAPDGSALIYSTYLGGSGGTSDDWGYAIKVDALGAAYLTGMTGATGFPRVRPLPIRCPRNPYESSAFLTKVAPGGNSWEYSTCLGGTSNDSGFGIVVDDSGAAYVVGSTLSDDFPVRNAIQPTMAGFSDGFIAKILCDSVTAPSVFEDAGPAVFSVHLCPPRGSDIAINYFTSDGSAIAGSDYVSTSGMLTIPAGETDGTIQVPLLGDTELEPEENFFLHLASADIDLGEGPAEARLLDSDALLYDNFEDDVMDWDVIKGECWEQGGTLIAFGDRGAAAFAPVPWIPSGAFGCNVCTIETRIALASDGSDDAPKAILETWYQNSGNELQVIIKEQEDKWVLKQRSGGHVVAKAKASAIIDQYVEYDVTLSFDGTNFTLSVNGVTIISMKASAPPYGKVGLKVKHSVGTLNHIRVF